MTTADYNKPATVFVQQCVVEPLRTVPSGERTLDALANSLQKHREVAFSRAHWPAPLTEKKDQPGRQPNNPMLRLFRAGCPVVFCLDAGYIREVWMGSEQAGVSAGVDVREEDYASDRWSALATPAPLVRELPEVLDLARDLQLSGKVLLHLLPLEPASHAELASYARRLSILAERDLTVTEGTTTTKTKRELVPTTTMSGNGGWSMVFVSRGMSMSRQTHDQRHATDRAHAEQRSESERRRQRDVQVEQVLRELQRLFRREESLFEVRIELSGELVERSDTLLNAIPNVVAQPFDRVVPLSEVRDVSQALLESIPKRIYRCPRLNPPGGDQCVLLAGAKRGSLRRDDGTISTITGPVGTGKTFLAASIITQAHADGAICIILDGEKDASEQQHFADMGFDVCSPADLMHRGVALLGMEREARKRIREALVALVPGGGPVTSIFTRAFDADELPEPEDIDNARRLVGERFASKWEDAARRYNREPGDTLRRRLRYAQLLTLQDFAHSDGEVISHVLSRIEMLLQESCSITDLVRDGQGAPLLSPNRRMVVCLGSEGQEERALFVLCFLASLRIAGRQLDNRVTVILDEMSSVFGGRERQRRPDSATEDTSESLLARSLESAIRLNRQRGTSFLYVDQCLKDIPEPVRARAGYHFMFHQVNVEEIEIFRSLSGVRKERARFLYQEVESLRQAQHVGRLCLVGGPRVAQTYGQPYITGLVRS